MDWKRYGHQMGVRYSVVWMWVALGLAFLGCGGTSKKPTGEAPPATCTADNCPEECRASAKFCFDGQIWKCAADGKSATSLETCAAGDTCSDAGPVVKCESPCQGPDCTTPACTAKQKECREGDVFQCDADGKEVVLFDDCDEAEVCDPVAFACLPVSCQAGQLGCSGTQVTECNQLGTGFEPTVVDCASAGETCSLGACVEQACPPGERLCIDNQVHICNVEGTALVHNESCGQFSYCVDDASNGGLAHCRPNTCVPGHKLCDNNVAKVCADDGTVPAEGTDCSDELCDAGVCLPALCVPFTAVCVADDDHVHECGSLGTTTHLLKTCEAGTRCGLVSDGVECVARPCVPGATACLNNVLGKCHDDGESLSQVTQNCASTQLVCNATPSCSASAVDLMGVAEEVEYFSAAQVLGNVVDVHSDRRLTLLEANLLLEAPRDLRWVVYEQVSSQTYELVCTAITANNSGSAFFASGALDCELSAGKRYLLGVAIMVGEGYLYFDAPPYSRSLSFGSAAGRAATNYATTTFVDVYENQYRLRFTTELP